MSYPKPADFVPVPDFPKGHRHYGKARCQAWNPAKGRQCMGLAMTSLGLDKCKGCGGKSLRGEASPSFKHGRYSKVLPTRLASRYETLVTDSEIMDMKSRATLLETRIAELVANLDEEGSYAIFKQLKSSMDTYRSSVALSRRATEEAAKLRYAQQATEALSNVSNLIDRGLSDGVKWDEIQRLVESIRRLADTEQRQIKTAESAVMVDRVLVFATMVASIFKQVVERQAETIPPKVRRDMLNTVATEVQVLLQAGEYQGANTNGS